MRQGKLVLLAEDDKRSQAGIETALQQHGFQVEIVESGPGILEKAVACKPDVLLLKEILPGLNGSAAVNLLSVMPSLKNVPIAIYDEHGSPAILQKAESMAAINVVIPSGDPRTIAETLVKLCR
jgi:CheY-like chemotaxis protein